MKVRTDSRSLDSQTRTLHDHLPVSTYLTWQRDQPSSALPAHTTRTPRALSPLLFSTCPGVTAPTRRDQPSRTGLPHHVKHGFLHWQCTSKGRCSKRRFNIQSYKQSCRSCLAGVRTHFWMQHWITEENHRVIQEKTFKITNSNHQSNLPRPITKPCLP